ncbi:hypothetical protein [Paraburkholderia fungorum]|uniref:hypothetical protein n=1 Tax=Paraburkholderia fungorum TaxID=134537 RepID=UPI0004075DCF|nr:hypothetical protein [Paraburkholderia fungorum]PZR48482.1 MAG: hypothetical protein DI523_10765 [Paraburkholderia fungorum]
MQIWNPNSGEPVALTRLLEPFEGGRWGGFTAGPALHACLSDDVPLPTDSHPVRLHFSGMEYAENEERPVPVIVVTGVLSTTVAVHWLFDATDPVTWRAMAAWDGQRGCQVLASHDDDDRTVALGCRFPDDVHPGGMFPELRALSGHGLTAYALHAMWHTLDQQRFERQAASWLKYEFPDLAYQSFCIVATPRVAECAAAQPVGYVGNRML